MLSCHVFQICFDFYDCSLTVIVHMYVVTILLILVSFSMNHIKHVTITLHTNMAKFILILLNVAVPCYYGDCIL